MESGSYNLIVRCFNRSQNYINKFFFIVFRAQFVTSAHQEIHHIWIETDCFAVGEILFMSIPAMIFYFNSYDENMEHKKQITPRRRRVGYPPVTPNACVKDSVSSEVFDSMWQEVRLAANGN